MFGAPKPVFNLPSRYGDTPPEQVWRAFNALRKPADRYLTEEDLDWPGYILYGPPGVGKTGVAILMAQLFADRGHYARFEILWDIASAVKATWGDHDERSEREAISTFVKPKVLIADDAGVQFGSEAERNILYRVVVGRYNDIRPTIITTNCDLNTDKGLKKFEDSVGERVYDRFKSWAVDASAWGHNLRRKKP